MLSSRVCLFVKKTWVDIPDMWQKGVIQDGAQDGRRTLTSWCVKLMHSWHLYTPVSLSTTGHVLKLTMLHCSSGIMNGLIEMPDP